MLWFASLGGTSASVVPVLWAFAAGAILAVRADTMMPKAFENGGSSAGVVSTVGFVLAVQSSRA